MKVFHVADLHYGPRHLAWVDRAMTHAVDVAIAERCDLAIVAGDSFDHALNVHEPAVAAYLRQVVKLAESMPVVVLQGTYSHDRPGSLDVLKAIPTRHAIHVADTPTQWEVAGVLVTALPSLNKADSAIAETGAQGWVRSTLRGFAERNAQARADGMPTILVTHGTVTGCQTESGYAMVSPDHEFSVDTLADADADAVLLGHIHAHQAWPDVLTQSGARSTIAYPGSLARLVHGHRAPVGFLIWDISPGAARFDFRPSPARQLLEITFDGPPNMEELEELAKSVTAEDAVRIRFEIDEEHAASVDRDAIRELFAGAETLKIEGRVLPVQRVRAEGIGRAATLAAKLEHWAKTTDSEHALTRLQDRLSLLQGHDADSIVARILGADVERSTQVQEAA